MNLLFDVRAKDEYIHDQLQKTKLHLGIRNMPNVSVGPSGGPLRVPSLLWPSALNIFENGNLWPVRIAALQQTLVRFHDKDAILKQLEQDAIS